MPRWHGRIPSNAQNRRNNYVPRRPLSERNNNCPIEQRLTSTLILNNTDQRCIIFTLVSPEIDDYFKLAAFIQSLSYTSQRKDTQPAPLPEPAPALTLLFNLQKENNSEISENTCPPNPSQMDIMSRSRNRNKRTKSFKDISGTSSHRYLAVDNSSSSPCDSLSPISSDDLVSDITTVDNKPLKRNSKKKGKKKGKNYKASPCKKDSGELSEDAKSPPILNKDTNKMEGGNVSNITESSETMVSSTSYNDDEFSKSNANVLEIDSDRRQYNPSTSNVVTIESDTRESYYSEGVFHAHSSTERSQNSIEACSSNDFQPVISCKRGRSSRKLANYSGKDSTNCSVWQKVQKDNVSSKVAASSKGSSFNYNQKSKPMVGEPAKSSVTSVNKKQANNYLRIGPPTGNTNHARSSKIDIQKNPASNNLPIDAVKSPETHVNDAKSSRDSLKQIDVKMHKIDVNVSGFESTSSGLQCNSSNQSKAAECIMIESRPEPELQKVAPQENPEAFTPPIIDDSKSNIMQDTKSSESEAAMGMQGSSRSGDDADCSSSETDISSGSYVDSSLSKILNASTDSYRLQAATSIQMADGSPLAEFERFVLSATPVINQGHHIGSNISLASVWQWYEEPGCFGLEVRAKDMYKYNRLPDSSLEFSAYFVPFLSAVQLFGKACEDVGVSVSSSNLSSLSILSALLPRPGSSASAKDVELIFEYFEHAQPPQRQPLFDKIKELVSEEGTSNMNMYGNPSALESLNLCDLHPASWYAVAWYPICRIPDGNFRAAFLTYHSLGHFDKQSCSSKTTDGDFSSIISPVIGLQSYNAKKECWFQPRSMRTAESEKEEVSTFSTKLLEERLQMLEKTASILATATICKGNEKSINNHPDHTHFFSRW